MPHSGLIGVGDVDHFTVLQRKSTLRAIARASVSRINDIAVRTPTGLADNSEYFAAVNMPADSINRFDRMVIKRKVNQIVNVDQSVIMHLHGLPRLAQIYTAL